MIIVHAGIGGESVDLGELLGVVDELYRDAFAVFLCEILAHAVEAAEHTTDGDARHHDDELCPAVELVQLEHRLDVGKGLTCARLHLDGQRAAVALKRVDGFQSERCLHLAQYLLARILR